MSLPKLLAELTVPSGWEFAWMEGATARVATITAGTYTSFYGLATNLAARMTAVGDTYACTCSSTGFLTITKSATVWSTDWTNTTDALASCLGFAQTEAVTGSTVLTASRRHTYAWYSPVGCAYPLDEYWVPVKEQETESGDLSQFASSIAHRYRALTFHLVSPEAMAEGGTEGGVYWTGRTLYDLWKHVRDRPFRFYPDRAVGNVGAGGTEGTDYVDCKRMGDEWSPVQVDPNDWAYWRITIRTKVV